MDELTEYYCNSCSMLHLVDTSIVDYVTTDQKWDKRSRTICTQNKKQQRGHSVLMNLRNNFLSLQWCCIVVVLILLDVLSPTLGATTAASSNSTTTQAATTVTANVSSYTEEPIIPKAVIVVAGLFVFFIMAIAIAKLIDYCHDRRAISDDASDISDYTKELLKAQMMMLAFNRGRSKGKKLKPDEAASKYGKVWRAKVARNKARMMKVRKEAAAAALAEGKDPEKAADIAAKELEEKRIKAQIGAHKASKNKGKKAAEQPVNSEEKTDVKKVETEKDGEKKSVDDQSKPSTHNTPAKLFTITETNSKPSDGQVNIVPTPKLDRPGTAKKGSSRPISAGLKSKTLSRSTSTISIKSIKTKIVNKVNPKK